MIKPRQLIVELKSHLEKNPLVLGLVLVGSYAREDIYNATKYSDIEAYIIVKDRNYKKLEKKLPELVKRMGNVIFSYNNRWAGFSTLYENLLRLELPIVKLSELSSVFSRPKSQTVKILIDNTNGKLQDILDSRTENLDFEKLFKYEIEDSWYMLTAGAQYFKKGELFNAKNVLQIFQSSLIKLFELLETPDALLLESNKRVEQFLNKDQLKILKDLNPNYDYIEIKKSLLKAFDSLLEITEKVSRKYKYKYNRDLEEKIKPKIKSLLD